MKYLAISLGKLMKLSELWHFT